MQLTQIEKRRLRTCAGCPELRGISPYGRLVCGKTSQGIEQHARANHCPIGTFGGTAQPEVWTVAKIAHGALGIVKAITRRERPPAAVIEERRRICGGCDQVRIRLGLLSSCKLCGCGLAFKTAVASEACPIGKWGKVEPVTSGGTERADDSRPKAEPLT